MPKLSQQTMEKRFPCPHCGKTLRTRQGLSGHIQYKHPPGASVEKNEYMKPIFDASKFKMRAEIAGFNKKEMPEMLNIFSFWNLIKALIENENIKLNECDFKTYLIMSLSQMKANQLLFDKLQGTLAESITGLLKIQSNINETIFLKSSQ